MTKLRAAVPRAAFISFLMFGMMPATGLAGDLSRYRDFQLGTDLPTIAKQLGANPSEAKAIHRRPALIQELDWRPQPLGASPRAEAAQDVVFSFYEGKLFQIAVHYDRYATEGLTARDLVEAISSTYGPAAEPNPPSKALEGPYGDPEEVLARWQDSEYSFELIRSSYGPSYRLMGTQKVLAAQADAANLESKRIDDQEAPQREAARVAGEAEVAKTKLEQARLANKLKFRP